MKRTVLLLVILCFAAGLAQAQPTILSVQSVVEQLPNNFMPGVWVCIEGTELASAGTSLEASGAPPYPLSIAGTEARFTQAGITGFINMYVFAVTPNKVIAMIPFGIVPGAGTITIARGGVVFSNAWPVNILTITALPAGTTIGGVYSTSNDPFAGMPFAGTIIPIIPDTDPIVGGGVPTPLTPVEPGSVGAIFFTGDPGVELPLFPAGAGGIAEFLHAPQTEARRITGDLWPFPLSINNSFVRIICAYRWIVPGIYIVFFQVPDVICCWAPVNFFDPTGSWPITSTRWMSIGVTLASGCRFFPPDRLSKLLATGYFWLTKWYFDIVTNRNGQTTRAISLQTFRKFTIDPPPDWGRFGYFPEKGCSIYDVEPNEAVDPLAYWERDEWVSGTFAAGGNQLEANVFNGNPFAQNPGDGFFQSGPVGATVNGVNGNAVGGSFSVTANQVNAPNVSLGTSPGQFPRVLRAGEDTVLPMNNLRPGEVKRLQVTMNAPVSDGARTVSNTQRVLHCVYDHDEEVVVPAWATFGWQGAGAAVLLTGTLANPVTADLVPTDGAPATAESETSKRRSADNRRGASEEVPNRPLDGTPIGDVFLTYRVGFFFNDLTVEE